MSCNKFWHSEVWFFHNTFSRKFWFFPWSPFCTKINHYLWLSDRHCKTWECRSASLLLSIDFQNPLTDGVIFGIKNNVIWCLTATYHQFLPTLHFKISYTGTGTGVSYIGKVSIFKGFKNIPNNVKMRPK